MRPGTVIASRYRLVERVTSGGMATIFRAVDTTASDRLVALKLTHTSQERERDGRLRREAIALARLLGELRHPGVVEYIDHGFTKDGRVYLAMEWLDGCDLRQRLRRGPLSQAETIALGVQIADILTAVHERGVIHRDIKPDNLFLVGGELGRVKLVDFGLVRLNGIGATMTALTEPGVVMGTPGYMAPEQIRSAGAIDARSDLYALGATLFACLTGQAPFTGDHVMAILAKMAFEPPPRLREVRGDISAALDELVCWLMAKNPAQRPTAAGEAERAIAAARDRLLDRAARIDDPDWRQTFLDAVAENRRTLDLARAWLGPAFEPGDDPADLLR
ncbi:MAG: serine/threonine-protein kinase [Myxococcota bacterium]